MSGSVTMRVLMGATLVIAVSGCSRSRTDEEVDSEAATIPSEIRDAIVDTPSDHFPSRGKLTGTGGDQPSRSATDQIPAIVIPTSFTGTWGQVAADCDAATGADKGVMVIGPMELQFFESRARLISARVVTPTHLRALFVFTGEGSNWSNEEELTLQADGKSLIRREFGKDAFADTLKYARCPMG